MRSSRIQRMPPVGLENLKNFYCGFDYQNCAYCQSGCCNRREPTDSNCSESHYCFATSSYLHKRCLVSPVWRRTSTIGTYHWPFGGILWLLRAPAPKHLCVDGSTTKWHSIEVLAFRLWIFYASYTKCSSPPSWSVWAAGDRKRAQYIGRIPRAFIAFGSIEPCCGTWWTGGTCRDGNSESQWHPWFRRPSVTSSALAHITLFWWKHGHSH